jgi:hypothetical protein
MLEGPLSLGVAAVIAHRTQSVISYLWPVNPFVAAAFAALLAHELTADPDHAAAFRRALRALGTGQQPIASRLRDAGLVDVAERVENNNVGWNSVFAWGSPVMLL